MSSQQRLAVLKEPTWRKGSLSKKAVMEVAAKLDQQAKHPRSSPAPGPGPGRLRGASCGGISMSVLLLSVASFLMGLLLGRGSKRL